MNRRLEDERFADWVDGRLDEVERLRLEAELQSDPELRAAAEEYRRTVAAVRDAMRVSVRPVRGLADRVLDRAAAETTPVIEAPRLRLLPWVGSAAAAAALVSAFLWVQALDDSSPGVEAERLAYDAQPPPAETQQDRGVHLVTAGDAADGLPSPDPSQAGVKDATEYEDLGSQFFLGSPDRPGAAPPTSEREKSIGRAAEELARAPGSAKKGPGAVDDHIAGDREIALQEPVSGDEARVAQRAKDGGRGLRGRSEQEQQLADERKSYARGMIDPAAVEPVAGAVVYVVEFQQPEPGSPPQPKGGGRGDAGKSELAGVRTRVTADPFAAFVDRLVREPIDAQRAWSSNTMPPSIETVDLKWAFLTLAPAEETAGETAEPETVEDGPRRRGESESDDSDDKGAGRVAEPGRFEAQAGDLAYRLRGDMAQRDGYLRQFMARVAATHGRVKLQRAPFAKVRMAEVRQEDPGDAESPLGWSLDLPDVLLVFRRAAAGEPEQAGQPAKPDTKREDR